MTRLTEFKHPSHRHDLILQSAKEPYKCNGCKELGFGSSYQCKHHECNFHLHEECALIDPPTASHPYLEGCELVFREESRNKFCDACGKDVLGFSYQCTHKRAHDLHPCCLNLSKTISGDDGIQLRLSNKLLSKCLNCESKIASNGIKGWCYISDCGEFCYHVACVKDLIIQNFKRGYFNQSTETMNYLALPTSSTSTALARRRNGSMFGDKAKKLWKITKMVLKFIISAIFGDPTGGVAILIESLIS